MNLKQERYAYSFQSVYDSLMVHLGELMQSKKVNQPFQLGERVRTNNSSFYLYRCLLFCGVT